MIFRAISILLLGLLSTTLSARAQNEPTVGDLTQLFRSQMQVFEEAETKGLGKTRGLTLVTVDDIRAEPVSAAPVVSSEAPTVEMPAASDGGVTISATAETPPTRPSDPNVPLIAAAADGPMVFAQLQPELQVNLHIEFGFDSAAISDDQVPKIEMMCQALRQAEVSALRVVGHTDSAGSDAYNQNLSMLRAKEVARRLVESCGITALKLETVGVGERFPFNKDDTRADENRRVEFQALS